VVPTGERSSGARLTAAATGGRCARVETPRRGTETAPTGGAVRAGAAWMPGGVERPRPAAVRRVDGPQAVGSVAPAGQAGYGAGTPAGTRGLATPRPLGPRGGRGAGAAPPGPPCHAPGGRRRGRHGPGEEGVAGAPAGEEPVGTGSSAGRPPRERARRARPSGGRRASAAGGRQARGPAAGPSPGGPAHPGWQRPVGGSLATDRAAGAATGLAAAAPAPGSPLTATASGSPEHPTPRRPGHPHEAPTAGRAAHAAHGPPLVRADPVPRPQRAVPTAARPPLAPRASRPSQIPSPQRGGLRKTLTETHGQQSA
jgi:hypothetical protein